MSLLARRCRTRDALHPYLVQVQVRAARVVVQGDLVFVAAVVVAEADVQRLVDVPPEVHQELQRLQLLRPADLHVRHPHHS